MGQIRITVEVDLVIEMKDNLIDPSNTTRVLDEMNYNFEDTTGLATIIDSQVVNYIYRD